MSRRLLSLLVLLTAAPAASAQDTVLTGEQLAKRHGCFTCHDRVKDKVGPSFQSIAAWAKTDVSNYAVSVLTVGSRDDLPTARKSTVILAKVGEKLHVRIFDASGRRVVDKVEEALSGGAEVNRVKQNWAGAAPDAARPRVAAEAAALAGFTPEALRERLISTVKTGAKGKWTHLSKGVPMPSFRGRMTDAEITRVLDFLLRDGAVPSLRVMATGLGDGKVTSNPAGIDCGGDCDEAFAAPQVVTLTATAAAGSRFDHWEGDATGSANPVTVNVDRPRSVRAVFLLAPAIPKMRGYEVDNKTNEAPRPEDIQAYLTANPSVNTPARFLHALPDVYRQNWILMTRSESLQTGTASSPRILLPSPDGKAVFTIGLSVDASYPGAHPNAIEYMQWDAAERNFRFHEIVLDRIDPMGLDLPGGVKPFPERTRGVAIDDAKCSRCHSTQNVRSNGPSPGTDGVPRGSVKVKNKPNWDAYDSWGGMLPFNRDRIYQGTVEAAAFRSLMNPWTWRTKPEVRRVFEQLELQPAFGTLPSGSPDPNPKTVADHDTIYRIDGGEHDGHVVFRFDPSPPVLTEPPPLGAAIVNVNYAFDGKEGTGTTTPVSQGGDNFVLLHHTSNLTGSDVATEGRGVQLFDTLGGLDGNLNPLRIADELVHHRWATGGVPIDVRPVALAITRGLLDVDEANDTVVGTPALTVNQAFFRTRHGMGIAKLLKDTRTRTESVPRRKADIQKYNLDRFDDVYTVGPYTTPGLIQLYGGKTAGGLDTTLSRLRIEVFRRPADLGGFDKVTRFLVDREDYDRNTEKVTLYRYFLEPLGVSVDKWSMGVRGRSRTYSFADVFGQYTGTFTEVLTDSLKTDPYPDLVDLNNDAQLMKAVNDSLGAAKLPAADMVPTYTDVQRVFNKGCIECHGGLNYPPYSNFDSTGFVHLSEEDSPPMGTSRLSRSHAVASSHASAAVPEQAYLYELINRDDETCDKNGTGGTGMMPCGGPKVSGSDAQTVLRWIRGGTPFTVGDPHLRTLDGVEYDFQAAGEFVYLRDENFELQVRQVGVSTARPVGPNPHTGLTSCVSVNGAVALRLGKHRVTYQPGAKGMEVRLDGTLTTVPAEGVQLPGGGKIVPAAGGTGIQIETSGGTVVVITAAFWEHYKLWYVNVDARRARATAGLMGPVATGNWLPAMPDGRWLGPRPEALAERHKQLYDVFGKAWRVTDKDTLFDYAAGTTHKSFAVEGWPGFEAAGCKAPVVPGGPADVPPQPPIGKEQADQLTKGIVDPAFRRLAIIDVMATGEAGFAKAYAETDRIRQHKAPAVPTLRGPANLNRMAEEAPRLTWTKSAAAADAKLTYKLYVWPVYEPFDGRKFVPVTEDDLRADPVTISKTVAAARGKSFYWKVVVEDERGGVSESETRRFDMKQ